MAVIKLVTEISAPIERCFVLSRSIDLHKYSTAKTKEEAIEGVTSGLIGKNETVTWRAKHFGVYQKLTVKITEFNSPRYFKDVMLKGAFKRMEHQHFFEEKNNITTMSDHFIFETPFGVLGKLVEKIVLKNYLTRLLENRNYIMKQIAESEDWKKFPSIT